MHARLILALPLLALIAASNPIEPAAEPIELTAKRALAEAQAAEAQVARLQRAADREQSRR